MDDLLSLIAANQGEDVDTQSLIAALRKQQMAGQALQILGDKKISGVGGSLAENAQQDAGRLQTQLAQAPQQRMRMALEQQQIAKGQADQAEAARLHGIAQDPNSAQNLLGRKLISDAGIQLPNDAVVNDKTLGIGKDLLVHRQSESARRDIARIRGSGGGNGPVKDDVTSIADAIENGQQPPSTSGLYRYGPAVKAELSRRGFDLSKASVEWDTTKRHMATLNGPAQERLRQAIDFTSHSLDQIDGLYQEWQKVGPASGFKMLNRAALSGAKQMGGEVGAIATALEAQIADLTSEMGNVYMGGNSPTDSSLKLAAHNLSADWDEPTFKKSFQLLRNNLKLRLNAMANAPIGGLPGGSRYAPSPGAEATAAPAAPALSPEDQKAVDWAKKNLSSPQAKEILKLHGIKP